MSALLSLALVPMAAGGNLALAGVLGFVWSIAVGIMLALGRQHETGAGL